MRIAEILKRWRLPRYSLRIRLFTSIFAIVALFTLTNITYQVSGDSRNQRLDNLQNAVQGQLSSVRIRQDLKDIQKEILVLEALKEAGEGELSNAEIEAGVSKLESLKTTIYQLESFTYPDSKAAYTRLRDAFTKLDHSWKDFYENYSSNSSSSTFQIETLFDSTIDELAIFESLEVNAAEQQTKELQSLSRFTDRVTLVIYLFTILLTVGLGYLLIRYTTSALRNLQTGTEKIGRGNLDYHIPVRSDDEIGDLAHAFNDMTDKLRNAMAQVQQSKEKADQANRAKTNFLANMSHELRTPLNAIIGYSEMNIDVFDEDSELDQEQTIKDLHHILDSGRHLLQLINDVLDLAKIESGNMTIFNETFSGIDLLKEIMTTMTPLANKNNNKLQLEAEPDLPPIYSDSIKFRQIFINLLSNACKFTSDGEITIKARLDRNQNKFIYEIEDTGIGMTREQLDNIFDAFVQAETSTSKNYGGTGLGLAICKEFVELMKGALDVKSAPGVGTSFIVTLPETVQPRRSVTVIPTANQQELDLPDAEANQNNDDKEHHEAAATSLNVIMRCSKELTNVFFLNAFQNNQYQLIPLTDLSKQIRQLDSFDASALVLELPGANRKKFNQSWSELLLIFHADTKKNNNFLIAYHQTQPQTQDKASASSASVIKLPALRFLHDHTGAELQRLVDGGDPPALIQRLRRLNPVGRRGSALLAGFCEQSIKHVGERLQIELSAEAWQCQNTAATSETCAAIKSGKVDLLLIHLTINDSDARQILDNWYSAILSLKRTHPDREIKAFVLSTNHEKVQSTSDTHQARLLESSAYEIIPIVGD